MVAMTINTLAHLVALTSDLFRSLKPVLIEHSESDRLQSSRKERFK